jgi:methyltransferase (TIGR00027 family)
METITNREKAEQIKLTADVVSQIRYLESNRKNPLVIDPFAHLFISPAGDQMLNTALQKWPFFSEYLVVREKYFDDHLRTFFNDERSGQLVMPGAGNDMRAERLQFLKDKKIFEVDLPEKITLKKKIVEGALGRLPEQASYISADLSVPGFVSLLEQQGFNPNGKKVFLLQGLIYYLNPSGVDSLFEEILSVFSPDDLLLLDHVSKDFREDPPYPGDPLEYLSARGFLIKESELLGNLTAHYFGKTYAKRWWVFAAGKMPALPESAEKAPAQSAGDESAQFQSITVPHTMRGGLEMP